MVLGLYMKFTESDDTPILLDMAGRSDDRYRFKILVENDYEDTSCHLEHLTQTGAQEGENCKKRKCCFGKL